MFDRIVVPHPPQLNQHLDVGCLAELLLYYGKVKLVVGYSGLTQLARDLGSDSLSFLLNNNYIELAYHTSESAVRTDAVPGMATHNFITFQISGDEASPKFGTADQIELATRRAVGQNRAAKRLAKLILDKARVADELGGWASPSLPKEAMEKVAEPGYATVATRQVLRMLVPNLALPPHYKFELIRLKDGLLVDTNASFSDISVAYRKAAGDASGNLTAAHLLSHIWRSVIDLNIASSENSELLCSPVSAALVSSRIQGILDRTQHSSRTVSRFHEFVFDDAKSIRETINSGTRSFSEFIDVLVKSRQFRSWLSAIDPDKDILREYHRACTEKTWIEHIGTKSVRFSAFAAGGIGLDLLLPTGLGTAAGIALGLADTFLLNRIVGGWRPNQFVDGALSSFLDSSQPT